MKLSRDKKLVKFYLWVGLGYFFLGLFSTLEDYPDKFFPLVFNHVWGVVYLIPLNFIFFEYTIPFVLRKRKVIIYNILLGIFFFWVHMMFWSYGSYAWRLLGIQVRVYTALIDFSSVDDVVENQMGYSAGSV